MISKARFRRRPGILRALTAALALTLGVLAASDLAVPPVPGAPWTGQTLHRVLVETLDLAKLRAVDAEALGEIAHYLPALFFAFNAGDHAVSTDFAPLTR